MKILYSTLLVVCFGLSLVVGLAVSRATGIKAEVALAPKRLALNRSFEPAQAAPLGGSQRNNEYKS
jgi:hypothetical protein